MSNDVVRYNNGLNTVPLRQFTSIEMDIFWSICSKMKRKGTQELIFEFDVFEELANYDRREKNAFYTALKSTWSKMKHLSYKFEDEHYFEELILFQRFAIDKDNEKVIIQASEKFEFILNSIGSNFTRFELDIMTKISSSYTKELYRQLTSHRDRGTRRGAWFVRVEDFRNLLSVPESYRMTDIDRQIFKISEREFTTQDEQKNQIFSLFKVEKVKAKKGNKIQSFKIYFEEPKPFEVPLDNWLEKSLLEKR